MKKELYSAITICLLITGALINILHLSNLVDSMSQNINRAISAYTNTDYTTAENELNAALSTWIDSDSYTHIFIRHSEIDAATDSYYDALAAVKERDQNAIPLINKVKYHIESILSMEQITLKSIF